jgi:hypothetical protein
MCQCDQLIGGWRSVLNDDERVINAPGIFFNFFIDPFLRPTYSKTSRMELACPSHSRTRDEGYTPDEASCGPFYSNQASVHLRTAFPSSKSSSGRQGSSGCRRGSR